MLTSPGTPSTRRTTCARTTAAATFAVATCAISLLPMGATSRALAAPLSVQTSSGVSSGVSFSNTSAPASTAPRSGALVRLGERSAQVASLQRALIGQGINVRGGADGYFGPATMAAVKTFQEQRGLVPNGEVNSITAHLLGLAPSPELPAKGQRGDLVRVLQQALVDAGISLRGGVDGYFGSATAGAITAFQASRSLPSTGIVDVATAIALGIVPGAAQTSAPTAPAPSATPSPSTPASTTVVLAVGQSGEAVKGLQQALIAAGVGVAGGADGRYGPATARAVSAYQTNMRLTPTGTVDTVTAQLLGLIAGPALPRIGERSNNVATLQQLLINAGIQVRGGADGIFGPVTKAAIAAFQTAQGLPATGELDLRTALFLGYVPGATAPSAVPPASTPPAPSAPAEGSAVITVFPVLGPCYFADTWQAPRSGGRRHEGVDIIAKSGTPIYAVTNGTITRQYFDQPDSLGGNALRLTAPNGTYFYYAHMSVFADSIKVGSVVRAGEVIGYVGATGNTTTPHLHLEYHPGGGAAVNPYPLVKEIDRCSNTTPPDVA